VDPLIRFLIHRFVQNNMFTSQDERELLAHFFAAFASQNIPRLVAYGSTFCDPEPSVETQHEIELRLKECKQSGALDLIHVINTFQDLNARFTKRSFGILKGIAVLQKEEDVSGDEFKETLSELIKNVLTGTWSAMARPGADQLGQQINEFADALFRVMRIRRSSIQSGSCPR
jgi:hypothetical protein